MKLNFRLDTLRPFWWLIVLYSALSFTGPSGAQTQSPASGANPASVAPSGQPATLTGVVLNAATNQPVARALVQAGSHFLLTEHDGKFQFSDASGSGAMLRVTKPGYYVGPDNNSPGKFITFGATTDPLKLYLYPEALITGTVTAPNGDPIPGVYVQALRKAGGNFSLPWIVAAQTSSNSDGQFRLPVSAGDYVIETQYLPDHPARRTAVLPAMVPDPGSGTQNGAESDTMAAQPAIHLGSGTQQQLDLRPLVRPTHDVHIQVDEMQNGGFPQIEAHLPSGLFFYPVSRQSGTPGEFIVTLPTGSYTLIMNSEERGTYGQATVTVADSDLTGVVLHLARLIPVPVEVSVDAASSSASTSDNTQPPVQQLGLYFIRWDQTAPQANNPIVHLRSGRGEPASFTLTPGRYRLQAQESSDWFIESATIGGTDLLTQPLEVDAGSTSAPLRITVSKPTATLKGIVNLDATPAGNCGIYLIRTSPGLTPVIVTMSDAEGSFSRASLPPGDYRAVALEVPSHTGMNDSATLQRLASYIKTFTVAAGGSATVNLDAVRIVELMH